MTSADDEPHSSRFNLSGRIGRFCTLLSGRPESLGDIHRVLEGAQQNGLVGADTRAMIEGIFQVAEMRVKDIMVPRSGMVTVAHDASLDDVLKVAVESGHSRFPVISDDLDDIRGMLLAKDLLRDLTGGAAGDFKLEDYLRQAVIVPQSKRLNALLDEFRRSRNHIAMVVDEYSGVCGLVTIEDVLERIVGDISDEHDVVEEHYIYNHGGGRYSVKALTPLESFNGYFSTGLDSKAADTVGGLITETLGHTPRRGEKVSIGGFLFEIVHADNRRVHLVAVKRNA